MPRTLNPPRDRISEIWSTLSSADRHALLGHDSDELSAADKTRLAKMAAAIRRQRRPTGRR